MYFSNWRVFGPPLGIPVESVLTRSPSSIPIRRTRARSSDRPHLRGLDAPLRLADLGDYVRSLGPVPGLIPCRTFQGTPIRRRGLPVGTSSSARRRAGRRSPRWTIRSRPPANGLSSACPQTQSCFQTHSPPRDLRHSFASGGLLVGAGLPMIGKLLGRTQVQTTTRYAHLANDPVKSAANRIAAASPK